MVVIFGWGAGEAKDLGEIAPTTCPNCRNQVFLHHIRTNKQVSRYFIPMASYGGSEYLSCPICRHGMQLRPAASGGAQEHALCHHRVPQGRTGGGRLSGQRGAVLGSAGHRPVRTAGAQAGHDDPAASPSRSRPLPPSSTIWAGCMATACSPMRSSRLRSAACSRVDRPR